MTGFPDQAEIDKRKAELLERRQSVLMRAAREATAYGQAAIQLVEDGMAHPSRAMGSGRPIWWVHCWPWHEAGPNQRGVGFPYVSQRNLE